WLPVITLALFGLGIAIARRRSTAVLGTGIGLAVGGGALALSLAVGGTAVGIVAGELDLSAAALDVIYSQLVDAMQRTSVVIAVLGLFVALIGWLMGRSSSARTTRTAVHNLNSSARVRLAERGLDTRGFGTWLGRHRVLVRTGIAVLAVLWMLLLRPLSFGDVVLVVVVAFAVAWILELLQRRPEEHVVAEAVEVDVVEVDVIDPLDDVLVVSEAPDVETTDAAAAPAAASASKKKPPRV
ncbi:MAG: hypothetical protein ABWY55_10595, partial [Microbacterium sp.]